LFLLYSPNTILSLSPLVTFQLPLVRHLMEHHHLNNSLVEWGPYTKPHSTMVHQLFFFFPFLFGCCLSCQPKKKLFFPHSICLVFGYHTPLSFLKHNFKENTISSFCFFLFVMWLSFLLLSPHLPFHVVCFVRVPTLGEEPHLTKICIIKMLVECCSLLLLLLLLLLLFLTSDLLFWSSFSPPFWTLQNDHILNECQAFNFQPPNATQK
jgi:hypothetical protein